ncbi:LAGLIDADG family homing endonuclease [Metabacillus sp. cB07]|uniref:LAGLIDADG family homing endonuclease n=1 Tax=Metabacillus sp. cB07 TaxID=2806989 RepID=UPI0019399325|nr:LAGLIDADG family homing endonuclease [Metabacillus sp. cB07]
MSASKNRKCLLESEEVIRLYKDGKSTSEIAELAGVTAGSIRNILSKHDVEMRPRGSWKRKYVFNEHYFKQWSPTMAYLLGFFAADGCIHDKLQQISISQKESYILNLIKKELNTDQPLVQNKKTGVFILNLNSKIMKSDLIDLHGFTSNKSGSVKFPYVPEEYISHFIRGYFDGDGYVNHEKKQISFVSGSKEFIFSLNDLLEENGFEPFLINKENISRLFLTGARTIQLFGEWIYRNKTIYLTRKFNEFRLDEIPLEQLNDRPLKMTKTAVNERLKLFKKLNEQNKSIEEICSILHVKPQTIKNWRTKYNI